MLAHDPFPSGGIFAQRRDEDYHFSKGGSLSPLRATKGGELRQKGLRGDHDLSGNFENHVIA